MHYKQKKIPDVKDILCDRQNIMFFHTESTVCLQLALDDNQKDLSITVFSYFILETVFVQT